MAKQPKRIKAFTADANAVLPFADAIKMVKDNATAKFDESIEIAVNLGVDPRHADQQVRGVVNLPSGTGRDVRVAVFAKDAKADEAQRAGRHRGAEDLYGNPRRFRLRPRPLSPDMMALVAAWVISGPGGLCEPQVGT